MSAQPVRLKSREAFEVALVQMTSVDDWDANLDSVLRALDEVEAGGACDLVCLPENALYFRVREGQAMPSIELDDPRLRRLAERAQAGGFAIHVGSAPLSDGGRTFAASILARADGALTAGYRKIHLFDVDVEGHKPVRESDAFAHGATPSILEIDGWRFGESICYDVRFAELYSRYAAAAVDAILIPAAFIVPTGRAHWEILTRARAIESQAYVLAAAQGGAHVGRDGAGTRATWGQSLAIDPWGAKRAEGPAERGGEGVLRVRLERAAIDKVRRQIPMARHRRPDLLG